LAVLDKVSNTHMEIRTASTLLLKRAPLIPESSLHPQVPQSPSNDTQQEFVSIDLPSVFDWFSR